MSFNNNFKPTQTKNKQSQRLNHKFLTSCSASAFNSPIKNEVFQYNSPSNLKSRFNQNNFNLNTNKNILNMSNFMKIDSTATKKDKEESLIDENINNYNRNGYVISAASSVNGLSVTQSVDLDLSIRNFNDNIGAKPQKIERNLTNFYDNATERFKLRVIKGPPESFRWLSWLVLNSVPLNRSNEMYLSILSQYLDDPIDQQIKKDLNRTLSDEPNFSSSKHSQQHLYNILRAFANIDKEINYCQGMNFVAGFLLIVSNFNENDVFYFLLSLFSESFGNSQLNIRGLFCEEFPLVSLYVFLFDHYFKLKLGNLRNHFKEINLPIEVFVSKWIQTLFTLSLPIKATIRLWDILIVKGLDFMINFCLALLKEFEDILMKFEENHEVIEFFRILGPFAENKKKIEYDPNSFDYEKVINYALSISISQNHLNSLKQKFKKENTHLDFEALHKKYDFEMVNLRSDKFINENSVDSKIEQSYLRKISMNENEFMMTLNSEKSGNGSQKFNIKNNSNKNLNTLFGPVPNKNNKQNDIDDYSKDKVLLNENANKNDDDNDNSNDNDNEIDKFENYTEETENFNSLRHSLRSNGNERKEESSKPFVKIIDYKSKTSLSAIEDEDEDVADEFNEKSSPSIISPRAKLANNTTSNYFSSKNNHQINISNKMNKYIFDFHKKRSLEQINEDEEFHKCKTIVSNKENTNNLKRSSVQFSVKGFFNLFFDSKDSK